MTFPARLLAPGETIYLDARPNWSLLFWPIVIVVVLASAAIAVVVAFPKWPIWVAWVMVAIVGVAVINLVAHLASWGSTSFVVTSQRVIYRTGIARRSGREIPISRVQDVTYRQQIVERLVGAGSLTVESAGQRGQEPFPDIRHPDEVQALINRLIVAGPAGTGARVADGGVADGLAATPAPGARGAPQTTPAPPMRAEPERTPWGRSDPAPTPTVPLDPAEYRPARSASTAPDAGGVLARTPPAVPAQEGIGSTADRLTKLEELHRLGVITDTEYEDKRREVLGEL